MHPHWTTEDFARLEHLTSYGEMAQVAFDILKRIPQPIAQVCGPLTTGGLGSLEKNIVAFGDAVLQLHERGLNVFDQRPFEGPMVRLKLAKKTKSYAVEILHEFYLPLFESGLIQELHFLPGWEASTGASWEHEQAQRLGITIAYFPQNWFAYQ